jgi:hypothetical protein
MARPSDIQILAGGAVLLMVAAWYASDKLTNIAAGAVGAVGDAGAGVAIGVGDILGIPRTNETECEKALREGRTWDASFACPAGTFIKSWF